jgi:hypothetical protein
VFSSLQFSQEVNVVRTARDVLSSDNSEVVSQLREYWLLLERHEAQRLQSLKSVLTLARVEDERRGAPVCSSTQCALEEIGKVEESLDDVIYKSKSFFQS